MSTHNVDSVNYFLWAEITFCENYIHRLHNDWLFFQWGKTISLGAQILAFGKNRKFDFIVHFANHTFPTTTTMTSFELLV